jgi:hypothetical protein
VLLFLPVPLVLFLFTRAPFGILPSLGIGVLMMLSHRHYARPWALARAQRRCLWCGAEIVASAASANDLAIDDPLGRGDWRACGDAHVLATRATLAWATRRQALLKVGILGSLAVFLAWAAASALRASIPSTFDDAVAFFRLGIALSVLPLGWLASRATPAPGEPLRAPFPLHAPALIGLRSTLWLFSVIGLVWLVQASLHVLRRASLIG